ncbi:MAG: Amuc_1100 family pilus-like protein [Verrucomicrobiota bacterium]
MSWIKRNLVFVICAAVAVILLGLAGYYLYAQWSVNSENSAKLEESYSSLERIAKMQPNPGNDKVDNIAIAKDHRKQVRGAIERTANFFDPAPPIPPGTNVTAADFSGALRKTIDELTRNAATYSVTLQPKYDFSFAAQRPLVKFAAGSLEPLAAQLGDVKAICGVLFKAKINMLYNLRRTRVSEDDLKGPQSDYLETTATTNEMAVMVPYEVVFYGFSGELASVLSGFAENRHGFIVTTLNVEPGTPSSNPPPDMAGVPGAYNGEGGAVASRFYGGVPPSAIPGAAPAGLATAGRGGLPILLDEKQLKVTMGVVAVKLLPKK